MPREPDRLYSAWPALQLGWTVPHPQFRTERALLEGRVPAALNQFTDGLIGGTVPISSLAGIDNPYCKAVN